MPTESVLRSGHPLRPAAVGERLVAQLQLGPISNLCVADEKEGCVTLVQH